MRRCGRRTPGAGKGGRAVPDRHVREYLPTIPGPAQHEHRRLWESDHPKPDEGLFFLQATRHGAELPPREDVRGGDYAHSEPT